MKTTTFLILLLGTFTTSILGQTTISGYVVSQQNEPIPFANVLVLNVTDSSLIKGMLTNENGEFSLNIESSELILKIIATGYDNWIKDYNSSHEQMTFTLMDQELDQLEVNAKTPLYSSNQGNMVINVDNTMLGYSSSITEILSKSPGLMVAGSEVEVVGKGKALIFMDDQKISFEALKSIPVSQIRSIEIVKNPDAMYDAQGMAVILVKLKEQTLNGFQGNLLFQYTHGFYDLGYGDVSLNFHKNKFTLNTALNNNIGATGARSESTIKTESFSNAYEAKNEYKEKVYLRNVPNILLGVKYAINEKNAVSAQYSGSYAYFDLDVSNDIEIQYANDSNYNITSKNLAITEDYSHSGSLNYKHQLDTNGSNLFMGATYNIINSRYEDRIREVNNSSENEYVINSLANGATHNVVNGFQLDWMQKVKTKGTFKLGAKIASSTSNSSVYVLNILELDTLGLTNNTLFYGEELIAGYTSYAHQLKKGNIQLGVRVENTIANAKNNGIQYIDTSYLSVFPNLKWSHQGDKIQIIESFTSRIQRPRFAEVTPYFYYINAFSSVKGNPMLVPSKVYTYEHKMIVKNLEVSLGSSLTKNPRVFLSLPSQSTGAITYQSQNLNSLVSSYLETTYSMSKGIWSSAVTANFSLSQYQDDNYDLSNVKTTPALYLFAYNSWAFKKFATLEVSARYTNRNQNGRVEMLPAGTLDVSISRSFMDDKWSFQIGVYDIFRTDRRIQIATLGNDTNSKNSLNDTRYLRVTIARSFGKLKDNDYDHSNIGQGELNRAH